MRTHGKKGTKIYNTWRGMRDRTRRKSHKQYKDYGGRGIKVCEEWQSASNFVLWALRNGYEKGLQIDRINNDGDYCPENCRFVTPKENSRNRRNTKKLTIAGETKTVAEWCEQYGLSQYTVYDWIRRKGAGYAEQRISDLA